MSGILRAARTIAKLPQDTVPDTVLRRPGVRLDPGRLAAYARVCGFTLTDELPLTYPRVLGFGLAMDLMTRPEFPLPLTGIVHIGDIITQRRALFVGEELDVAVRAADLRPHDRGTQIDVVTEIGVAGEPVWTEHSTYLRRSRGRAGGGGGGQRPAEPARPTATWSVRADTGRRYARASGDHNPIHLYAVTALPFGYRRPIAHGMWTLARCVAAMAGRMPPAATVEAAFKLPIALPATVGFTAEPQGHGWQVAVQDARSGRPHLVGTITPLAPEAATGPR